MTNEQINRAIAERAMGWECLNDKPNPDDSVSCWCGGRRTRERFNPAESIADAMEAVDKWANENDRRHWHADNWGFQIDERYETTLHGVGVIYKHVDRTLPLAICLALLEATKGKP